MLQEDPGISLIIDEGSAEELTRVQTPWLVGTCDWKPKFNRKAVLWLGEMTGKPGLTLTYNEYIENSLGTLLELGGTD
mgnify:CR=1 FL=1